MSKILYVVFVLLAGCGMTSQQLAEMGDMFDEMGEIGRQVGNDASIGVSQMQHISQPHSSAQPLTLGRGEHNGVRPGTYMINTTNGFRSCTVYDNGIAWCP